MKIYISAENAKRILASQNKIVTQVRPELFLPFGDYPTSEARK